MGDYLGATRGPGMDANFSPSRSNPNSNSDPNGSMYLVLPVPFRLYEGRLYVEGQAANGLDRWADNFAQVTLAAPVLPEELLPTLSGFVWSEVASLQHRSRIEFQPLPWAYSPRVFFQELADVRKKMADSIRTARYLQFGVGGLIGDWAAVAAVEAIKQKRRYAIHTDRVEHELIRKTASGAGTLRKLKIAVESPLMKRYHRYLIQRCSLGLWHGADCFRAYSPWCNQNQLIHDVHTKVSDFIDDDILARKLDTLRRSPVLELCYAGRLDPMKAPLEWLRAIAAARDLGVPLQATWYGEGSLLEEAKAEVLRLNLGDVVHYPGFVRSREELLSHVSAAHAFVFTHITPESPRNLLEAMVSGTPILGYANEYALDLLAGYGGGDTVPVHNVHALGALIASLSNDREKLVELTRQAAANGRRFSDAAVFAKRSALIKQHA